MHQRNLTGFPAENAPEIQKNESTRIVFRHPWIIRLTHWVNAACLAILLMSGLQIFNAHPALYWGNVSTFEAPAFSISSTDAKPPRGLVNIGGHGFDATGVLGLSSFQGEDAERAFPGWATLPAAQDLATGRRWHFLFAWLFVVNGLAYLIYLIVTRQILYRVIPSVNELGRTGSSIWRHLTLRFPSGVEAKRYNVLQKLTYLAVICALLPAQVLAGLTMSPGMDSAAPFLLHLFGGRQSARTIHFIVANLLVLFLFVHVAMVLITGLGNNMRGMITGWFVVERRPRPVSPREAEIEP